MPSSSIRVHVLDEPGACKRELEVQVEAGTLSGALVGDAVGATVGVLLAAMVPTGRFGDPPEDSFGTGALVGAVGAVGAVLTLAAAGVPLGALLGMGRWRGGACVSPGEWDDGGVLVTVSNEELADTARRALREAGAERAGG